ncbi:MAG: protein translocase subunit SecF [Candidatus Saganbacteria bacterium]|nr:protein translocase subunit SecF [Candidatus Saganbacteria bacterium]
MKIIEKTKLWFTLSAILILLGVFGIATNMMFRGRPMNFGIDFTGGTILTLRFEQKAAIAGHLGDVRKVLETFNFRENVIQLTGENDLTVRTEPLENETRSKMIEELQKEFGPIELLEADTIGPVIGNELRTQAFWALLLATIGILIYVSFRFEFKYAVAATIALWHDAFITIGLIALLFRTVDSPFIAAILTILGYSINDTIVIFDRIRENMLKPKKGRTDFVGVVNESINQTMARSINTVLTVLFMNVCLLVFGGTTIKDFALTLLIGFTLGAYSSIFIASPILVLMEKRFGSQKDRR